MNQRCRQLAAGTDTGDCILYVMGRDQRVRDNHALLAAQSEALEHELPLLVVFNVLRRTGHRRREHYQFMVDGLKHVEKDLAKFDIPFLLTVGTPAVEIEKIAKELKPRTIYYDFSPLRGVRAQQKDLSRRVSCRVVVVDTHNIVPVWVASDKEEYAAHTLRRKLHKLIEEWAVEPGAIKTHPHQFDKKPRGATWSDVDDVVSIQNTSGIDHGFSSGETAARRKLTAFVETGLERYALKRNDPGADALSDLSPYLHYGQLSSLRIVLEILKRVDQPPLLFRQPKMPSAGEGPDRQDGADAYVEELVVRKELSDNFCLYQPDYDNLNGARDWAQKTLKKHEADPRETIYSRAQLEHANTHDDLWNAAQIQLVSSGKIHGYMRMYWAKKILEWSEHPADAIEHAIYLNDSYHIDGGDPNGYVGIMWSLTGVHDRPWFDRDIYGTIRYMSAGGISKKFDTEKYIETWQKN